MFNIMPDAEGIYSVICSLDGTEISFQHVQTSNSRLLMQCPVKQVFLHGKILQGTVKSVLRDHYRKRPPVLKDHIFLA